MFLISLTTLNVSSLQGSLPSGDLCLGQSLPGVTHVFLSIWACELLLSQELRQAAAVCMPVASVPQVL